MSGTGKSVPPVMRPMPVTSPEKRRVQKVKVYMNRRKPIEKMLKSEMQSYIHELLEKIEDLESEIVHLDECYGELESDNCDMYQQIQNSEPEHSVESLMHRMRIDGTLTSEFETYVDQLLMYRLI